MTDGQFLALFALSRMAPGPDSLLASLIGWEVRGWAGAVVASVGIFLPSSVLVYGLARLWARYRGAPWQRAVEHGLAPVAAGMILAAAGVLLRSAEGGWLAWAVALASAAVLLATRLSLFILLGAGALAFLLFWR
jgi:chromate transporter